MTDPVEDGLRRALESGAARFTSPSNESIGATRLYLAAKVRRRRRQAMSLTAAVLLVLAVGTVAIAAGRSDSSSRQVVAAGANHPAQTTSVPPTPGPVDGAPIVGVTGGQTSTNGVPPSTRAHGTTTRPSRTTVATTAGATTTIASGNSEVGGTVLFSPVCPVQRMPPDPACAPRPGPAHIQVLRVDGSVVTEGNARSDGTFALPVAPGSYTVKAQTLAASGAIGRGCTATPAQVSVTPGRVANVAVSCDTGIR